MKSLLNTLGGDAPLPNVSKSRFLKRKDSILDTVDTGFGEGNVLIKDCPNTTFKKPLFKEDYLAVFTSETEKELVRNNLGVIGTSEVTRMVKELVKEDLDSFMTIEKVEEIIDDLDLINTELNARADYIIPDKLFKL